MSKALWVPLDVNFLWDAAILGCDVEAQMLYVRALCLSKQTESHGFISRKQVASLCFGLLEANENLVKQLLESDLWTDTAEDYFIRSWFKYNKTPEELEKLSEVRAKAGSKGGRAKLKQVASTRAKQNQAEVEVEVEVENLLTSAPSALAKDEPSINGKSKTTRVPDPFPVGEDLIAWANQNVPGFDWRRESARFLDYWRGVPGVKGRKQDWNATWRNWMRNNAEGKFAR